MADTQFFASTPGKLPATADTFNEAGGKAYSLSVRAALAQYLMTGCVWGVLALESEPLDPRL